MIAVRHAEPADAAAIAAAHIEGWRVGYRGVVPDGYLDAPEFAAERRERWQAWTWNALGGSACFVGELHGRVVGFGLCGPERAEPTCDQGEGAPASTGRGEVFAFYLHPAAWGSGVAAALITACTAWLATEGFGEAVLWVLRDNPRGRGFYEKAGWSATGREQQFDGPHTAASLPFSLSEVEYATLLG